MTGSIRHLAIGFVATVAMLLLFPPFGIVPASGPMYRVLRPAGPDPHPAVVFVPGCDGFAPSFAPALYERRGEYFRAQGYIVVFADYLGRRGVKTCAGPVTHQDVARELVSAAAWARDQPTVDRGRITAIGWSYGGRGVLVALAKHVQERLAFSRAIVYYPDCRALEPWKSALPVLMLLGGSDDMTPASLCQEAVKRAGVPATVKIVVYAGARHAFDVPELPAKLRYGLATVGYDPQAAAAAREEVLRFLR
jgi:dienelactone hydrolase